MDKVIHKVLIFYLDNDIREIMESYDWLGTGHDNQWANKQEKEFWERFELMVKLLKESN